MELLLLLTQLELNVFTLHQFLVHCILFSSQFLVALPQVIEVLAKLVHLPSKVISSLQKLFLILLLTLLQSHIEFLSVSLHVIYQTDVVLLQFFVLDAILFLYLL